MNDVYEPMNPPQAEEMLSRAKSAIAASQLDLRRARLEANERKKALRLAEVNAAYSADCPKPVRGGATVGDRELFIRRATLAAADAFDDADTLLEIAKDGHRSRMAESVVATALAKSVGQSFSMAGAS